MHYNVIRGILYLIISPALRKWHPASEKAV